MKLEELVPPLELCKLIPKGEFEDSAFLCEAAVDMYTGETIDIRIIPRPVRITSNPFVWHEMAREFHLFAAPTLEEIMATMQFCRVYKKTQGFFIAVKEKDREVSRNGATAALKLWLELKGINAQKQENIEHLKTVE